MKQLVQGLLKALRNGQLRIIIMTIISTQLMRWGMFTFSCWLAKRAHLSESLEVGIYRYQSVASWVNVNGEKQEVYPERSLTLYSVRLVGNQCQRNDMHSRTHNLILPSVSLNTLRHVDVIGGSEMVFTPEGTVLYDELALGDPSRYGAKAVEIVSHGYFQPYLPAATNEFIQCLFQRSTLPIKIPCAISLLKDHSRNYYHWLLESLPRAVLAHRQQRFVDYPMLIDDGLSSQFIESLRLLSPTRKLITIPQGVRVQVQELCFPSVFSPTHDYYGESPQAEDFLIAPEAAALLREAFLTHVPLGVSKMPQQFIYVARSGGSHRAIRNEIEVISVLERMGFTIVYPGNLTFIEQIALFSNAKIIVGPTGAGMANIVFAKPDCKIAILAAATRNANYYLFAQLAQYLGLVLVYVTGKPNHPSELHSDYKVDINELRSLIAEFICGASK